MISIACAIILSAVPAREAELLAPSGEWVRGAARIERGTVAAGAATARIDQVISLRFPATGRSEWIEQGALLSSGTFLAGDIEGFQAGSLSMVSKTLGRLALEKKALAGLALVPTPAAELRQLLREGPRAEGVLLANGDFVAGPVEWINSATVGVNAGRRIVQVPRERAAVVRFAGRESDSPADRARQFVLLLNGEIFAGAVRSLDGSVLELETDFAGPVRLPAAAVSELWSEGGPLVPLSSLAPAAARQTPQFDECFPYRLDRSVAGGPLSVAGIAYERGIGCHSRCELEYDLRGAFNSLVAEIGIDDSAGGRGLAVFRVLVDGRQVFESTPVRGGEKARAIKAALAGASRLALVVDFGPDGASYGDHADWCRAVLVR